jgi:hypothetical protein
MLEGAAEAGPVPAAVGKEAAMTKPLLDFQNHILMPDDEFNRGWGVTPA